MSLARARTVLSLSVVSALVLALGVVVGVGSSSAAGTVLFQQAFRNNTADGTGAVAKPSAGIRTNLACLTASGNTATGVLRSCVAGNGAYNDSAGSGAMSLTPVRNDSVGALFAATSVPTSSGLDVSFTGHQWGNTSQYPADGIAFALAAVDPNNPVPPPTMGAIGGSLGYAALYGASCCRADGLANGYLGFGFDIWGNWSNYIFQGSGCPSSPYVRDVDGTIPLQVGVRGPGNGLVGYCALNSTATTGRDNPFGQTAVPMHGANRAASAVPARILINPTTTTVVTDDNVSVPARSYIFRFTPVGQAQRELTGALPTMPSAYVPSSTWLDANGYPKQLAFGWTASTGGANDNHEISNVTVKSLAAVAQLTVAQTDYTAPVATPTTALPQGSPVAYVVQPGVAATGAAENGSVTVTETVPAGVTLLSASGNGWVCGAPSGQTIRCTNSTGPFTAGSALPPLVVNAVVSGTSVTPSTVQGSSSVSATSDQGQAAVAATATAGTNPTSPAVSGVSPSSGSTAGGNTVTVSGTNLAAATSVQLGTSAQFSAGTQTVLLPCPNGVAAAGCFTVSGQNLVISAMPARAAGSIGVAVVNLGASSVANYTYAAVPAAPVVTAAAPDRRNVVVSWTVPATGGSAITGYTLTPVLHGVAQAPVAQSATSTSATVTGLTAGATYTFSVAAANVSGTGATGTSAAVVPFDVPGAPSQVGGSVGTNRVSVSWLPPTSVNGRPVTSYDVAVLDATTRATIASASFSGVTVGSVPLTDPARSSLAQVRAVNAAGAGPWSADSAAFVVNAAPTLSLPALPGGEVGASYTAPTFTAQGGTGPHTWAVSGTDPLPPGLGLAANGVLSGTPSTAGTYRFTVQVTDADGVTATQNQTLVVVPGPIPSPTGPIPGQDGVPYSAQLGVNAGTGTAPFSWTTSGGSLPAGLTLSTSGALTGTPTAPGTSPFSVEVSDAKGVRATATYSVLVTASPSLSFPPPPSGEVGVAYAHTLVVGGGTAPYTWSAGGALPAGLSLDPATGRVSGTPTAAGPVTVTIGVQDARGQRAQQVVQFSVAAAPVLSLVLPAGEVGAPYRTPAVVLGGTAPFSFTATGLPAGITVDGATGVVSGTPTGAGTGPVTVQVTDSFSRTSSASGTLVVVAAPSVSLTLPAADQGQDYRAQLTAQDGTGPFTWTVDAGALPTGLTLDGATGEITGVPTASGDTPVTLRVTDGFGLTAAQALVLRVRTATTLTLSADRSAVLDGGTVVVTAAGLPGGAIGTVTVTDTALDGPSAGTVTALGDVALDTAGRASITAVLTGLGNHRIDAVLPGSAAVQPATAIGLPLLVAELPAAPSVTAEAGVTGAVVRWDAPADGGSPLTGYLITPIRDGAAQTPVTAAATGVETTLTGLSVGATYTFAVVAVSALGSGPAGVSPVVVPYQVPSAPQTVSALTGTGGALVSWTPPLSDGARPITGYLVTTSDGAGTVVATTTVAASALSTTVSGLTPPGPYTFSVAATNLAGTGSTAGSAPVTVNPDPTLALTDPADGEVGAPYTGAAFPVSGGTGPLVWSVPPGELPPGLTLGHATGVLGGTPTQAGSFTYDVTVLDASGVSATDTVTQVIVPAPAVDPAAAITGQVGVAYFDRLTPLAGTGTGPFTWSVPTGTLPAGLSLDPATGTISGTPTTSGSTSFTVRLIDSLGQVADLARTVVITAAPSLSFPAPPPGEVGVAYLERPVVSGGTGPFAWSLTGTLPPGLTFDTGTGAISGTPTEPANTQVILTITDARGRSADRTVLLSIAALPVIGLAAPVGEIGVDYAASPSLSGGTAPYEFSAIGLPAGLAVDAATGSITGTPTTAGSTSVTVIVVDAFGQSASWIGPLVMNRAPSLAVTLPGADEGLPYAQLLAVADGTAPFTWRAAGLPAGLSLDGASGLVSGTPTAAGSVDVTVTVTDALGVRAEQVVPLVVRGTVSLGLSASTAQIAPGGTVDLAATAVPTALTGDIVFTDTVTSGPRQGSVVELGRMPADPDGTTSLTAVLADLGTHQITAIFPGGGTLQPVTSPVRTVQVQAAAGSVIVASFRTVGPAGNADQFVQLVNTGPTPMPLVGFTVVADDGTVTPLTASAGSLPPGASYLITASGYSGSATPDLRAGGSLGSGGLRIVAPDAAATVTDAVGFSAAGAHLGTPLTPIVGAPTEQYAWTRMRIGAGWKQLQDNAADFALVSASGGPVGGVVAVRGNPVPGAAGDPVDRTDVLRSAGFPGAPLSAAPNRVVVSPSGSAPGSLIIRRAIVNSSTSTATALQVRVTSLSQAGGPPRPGSGVQPARVAQLRLVDPSAPTTTVDVQGTPVTITNLALPAGTPAGGGGLNSVLQVPLPAGGLPPGGQVDVGFTFAVDTPGSFWFSYEVEALGLP